MADDHDHDGLVALYGLCTHCATLTAQEAVERSRPPAAAAFAAAPADWKRRALEAVRELCDDGDPFTADDVWLRVPRVEEPRAMGGVFREAERRGWIRSDGTSRPSTHPLGHARLVRIWQPTSMKLEL